VASLLGMLQANQFTVIGHLSLREYLYGQQYRDAGQSSVGLNNNQMILVSQPLMSL
jgi:hypothetical protein